MQIYGAPALNVNVRGQLVVEFDITLKPGLANGTAVSNQATLTAVDFTALSDDPFDPTALPRPMWPATKIPPS